MRKNLRKNFILSHRDEEGVTISEIAFNVILGKGA
jgi:hypothetical protein